MLAYLVAAIATICLRMVAAQPAHIIAIVLAMLGILAARPAFIPGLFVLFLSSTIITPDNIGTVDSPLAVHVLAGPMVICRIALALLSPCERAKLRPHLRMLQFWMIALVPAIAATYLGAADGNINWSRAIRSIFTLSSFFLGTIWAARSENIREVISALTLVCAVFVILALTGVIHSHLLFFAVGIVASSTVSTIFSKPFANRIARISFAALAVIAGVLGSFTMSLIVGIGAFLAWLSISGLKKLNRRMNRMLGTALLLSITLLSAFFGKIENQPDVALVNLGDSGYSLSAKIESKLFADRGPVWHEAFRQIVGGPYLFVPSGRPLYVDWGGSYVEWWFGSHNAILESLRNSGVLGGAFMIIIMIQACGHGFRILDESHAPYLKCFTAGLLATTCMGMAFGDFPIDSTVGFWIWSSLGLVAGIHQQHKKDYIRNRGA